MLCVERKHCLPEIQPIISENVEALRSQKLPWNVARHRFHQLEMFIAELRRFFAFAASVIHDPCARCVFSAHVESRRVDVVPAKPVSAKRLEVLADTADD